MKNTGQVTVRNQEGKIIRSWMGVSGNSRQRRKTLRELKLKGLSIEVKTKHW